MSEPKRASLITIDGGKKSKSKVPKTIRLTIDLSESNESVYPHINFRELVKAEETRLQGDCKASTNGSKGAESDPFYDNDDDVERIARRFEQKYGGSNMYSSKKKNRSKRDDFADIGAGYDENDSFIDNTDGYDEMIPPEIDTMYSGFYINSGCLEFQNVVPESSVNSDRASESDVPNQRKSTKRPLSSSESDESSSSTSDDESEGSVQLEGSSKHDNAGSENNTDGNKSSNETSKKNKMNKIQNVAKKRRKQSTDAPAEIIQDVASIPLPTQPAPAASIHTSSKTAREILNDVGKEPSVENNDGSTDSHTSDPATIKPVPCSENINVSSDSSCDPSASRFDVTLPASVMSILNRIQSIVSSHGGVLPALKMLDPYLIEMESHLINSGGLGPIRRGAYNRIAIICSSPATPIAQRPRRAALQQRGKKLYQQKINAGKEDQTGDPQQGVLSLIGRLKAIIDSMSPSLVNNYKNECQKIAETNKQIKALNAAIDSDDLQKPERRLPKRRFPWNEEVRSLLVELARIQGEAGSAAGSCSKEEAAAVYLRDKVLPMFPTGFVRLPTLLQQARLNKNQKLSPEMVPGRRGPKPAEYKQNPTAYMAKYKNMSKSQSEPKVSSHSHLPERSHSVIENTSITLKQKSNSELLASMNLPLNTHVTITEKSTKYEKDTKVNNSNILSIEKSGKTIPNAKNERTMETVERYNPPNSIGAITITPVPSGCSKPEIKQLPNAVTIMPSPKSEQINPNSEPQIRVKSAVDLYNRDIIAQIIGGKTSNENVNGVGKGEYYSKFGDFVPNKDIPDKSPSVYNQDLFKDVRKDVIDSAKSTVATSTEIDKVNTIESMNDRLDVVKPMSASMLFPELYKNMEKSISEKSTPPQNIAHTDVTKNDRVDVAKSQIPKSYAESNKPLEVNVTITEKIRPVPKLPDLDIKALKPEPAISPGAKPPDQNFTSSLANNLTKSGELTIRSRNNSPVFKGTKPDQYSASTIANNLSKSGELTVKSLKNSADVQSVIKQNVPLIDSLPTSNSSKPVVSTAIPANTAGLKSHRIVKKSKDSSTDPPGEVPITGSVIISPTNDTDPTNTKPSNDRQEAADSVAEGNDSDVELIEDTPQDLLNVPNPIWQPHINQTNDTDSDPKHRIMDTFQSVISTVQGRNPSAPISKPITPSANSVQNSYVKNSDEDKSKHSSVVPNYSEKSGEKTNSIKDDQSLDPIEADINTVMQDLKELTNFHDNSNKRYDAGVKNNTLGLYSQEHSAYRLDISHNNTALRKTDSTSIPDSITALSNNTQG